MRFWLGCNYWASNAGTDMWIRYDEKAIREDLQILQANGVEYMRVFPSWRDFQPVKILYHSRNKFEEYVMADGSAPTNPYFIDETMLERFGRFCDICAEYDMKLIVGILTGFMSGIMLIPPALDGRNLFTDPVALLFEQRFIKGFVTAMKDKENIVLWDLGNECNNLYLPADFDNGLKCDMTSSWAYTISNAIRAADPSRPVASGMASLSPERRKAFWSLQEHGECIDIMTTHPYSYFHPHCMNDYFTSIRSTMHATAQNRYFADISGKPCFVEEIGTLSTSVCSDEVSGKFMRVNLYSNWANDNMGLLWWCANEQNELTNAPYTWDMLEVELGMIDRNRQPKTYLKEMKAFSDFVKGLDFELPKPHYDAVCIVPRGYGPWEAFGTAFASYILGKQAHLNLRFAYADDPLPEADTYIMPSMITGRTDKFKCLKEKVAQGATLYLSNNGAFIEDMARFTGVEVIDSAGSRRKVEFTFAGKHLSVMADRIYKTKALTAQVLSADGDGNPMVTKNAYGKGTVYFVNAPLEYGKVTEFETYRDGAYLLYAELLKAAKKDHAVFSENPDLCITHHFDGDVCYCVLVNHSDEDQEIGLQIADGYTLEKIYRGDGKTIAPFDACVVKLRK